MYSPFQSSCYGLEDKLDGSSFGTWQMLEEINIWGEYSTFLSYLLPFCRKWVLLLEFYRKAESFLEKIMFFLVKF